MGPTRKLETSVQLATAKEPGGGVNGNDQGARSLPLAEVTAEKSLVRIAIENGASIEMFEKAFELQERIDARLARKAFNEAFSAFKKEAPLLPKTRKADFGAGKAKYSWAPLDEIAETLGPALAKHGLSYNWMQSQPADGIITVTCTLKHVQGHSETNVLSGPPDASGSKNPVQAISSGVSYLRRYTLLGVTGMATSDEDDDGHGAGKPIIDAAEVDKNCAEMANAKDAASLKFLYTVAYEKAQEIGDKNAMARYIVANASRKKELGYATR